MKYRVLGRTGFEVSDIAHGLWGMSGWSGSNDQQSLAAMQLAVDLGCNFFDTAWAYGDGKSDGLLGEIMTRNAKKRLYAASKIPPANQRWPALPNTNTARFFLRSTFFSMPTLSANSCAWIRLTCCSFMFGTIRGRVNRSFGRPWKN